MAENVKLSDEIIEQLLINKFCQLTDMDEKKIYVAPQKYCHKDGQCDYRFSLLVNGTLDGRGFKNEADLMDYMGEIGDKPILLYAAKMQGVVPLEAISSLAAITDHEKVAVENTYFFIPRSDMDRLGIKTGDDEHLIALAITGEDDCLYVNEDLVPNFYHLDRLTLTIDEIPPLKLPGAEGVIVEWDVEAGQAVDIWHGTFSNHPVVSKFNFVIGKPNMPSAPDSLIQSIRSVAGTSTSGSLNDAVNAISKKSVSSTIKG